MKKNIFKIAFILFLNIIGLSAVQAEKIGPYSVRYITFAPTPILQKMDVSSPIVEELATETTGIVLRWCSPEFPFGKFMFGNEEERLSLLGERMCEASLDGRVLFISGKTIKPDLSE